MENNTTKKKGTSIYYKKIRELLKFIDEDYEDNKYKNDKKIYISYDYTNLCGKGYYFRYKDQENVTGLNDARKRFDWISLDDMLKKLYFSKYEYSFLKNIDPNLIEILYNEKGENAVYTYLNELSKGKDADKKKLPYSMKYNLNSIMGNKNITFSKKIMIAQMAYKNKNISKVEFKVKAGKRIAAAVAAVGLLFSAVPKLFGGDSKVKKEDNHQSIIDVIENDEDNFVEAQKSKETTINFGLSEGEKNRIINETQKIIERHKNIQEHKVKEIEFGSVLKLPEGLQFMEGVSGGRKGSIGDELSPTDGIYVIDYYAEVSNDGVRSTHELAGTINQVISDSNQFVHISFVNGAKTIEEAKNIIGQEQQKILNQGVDNNKIQPRGWVSKDTIQNIYNNQQQYVLNKNLDIER